MAMHTTASVSAVEVRLRELHLALPAIAKVFVLHRGKLAALVVANNLESRHAAFISVSKCVCRGLVDTWNRLTLQSARYGSLRVSSVHTTQSVRPAIAPVSSCKRMTSRVVSNLESCFASRALVNANVFSYER